MWLRYKMLYQVHDAVSLCRQRHETLPHAVIGLEDLVECVERFLGHERVNVRRRVVLRDAERIRFESHEKRERERRDARRRTR